MTLDKLKIGQRAVVSNIDVNSDIRRRLMDIGIVKGTVIECVLVSPLGEPRAYLIRGSVTALRFEETSRIGINIM